MSRHLYTIHRRADGAAMTRPVAANNQRQALRAYAYRTCRDQRVPWRTFIEGFRAVYLRRNDGEIR